MKLTKYLSALLLALIVSALPAQEIETLHSWNSRTWYQDKLSGPAYISATGRYLVYRNEYLINIYDTQTGITKPLTEITDFDSTPLFNWLPEKDVIEFKGRKAGELQRAVYDFTTGELGESPIPRNAFYPQFGPDGNFMAAVEPLHRHWGIYIYENGKEPTLPSIDGAQYPGMALSPDGKTLAYIVDDDHESGWSSLYLYDIKEKRSVLLRSGLDMGYQEKEFRFSADSSKLYLSLVDCKTGRLEEKHWPVTGRNLDIWELDIETGKMRRIVDMEGDNLIAAVTDKEIIWTNQRTSMRATVLSIEGGEPWEVSGPQTCYPYWHPDGSRISVMWGEWHLADWALNWDIAEVGVDASGKPNAELKPLVQGYHEDFNLAWSPDGKWMAYHSHRADNPVPSYRYEGASDAIWLRKAEGGKEIKITSDEHYETLQAEWAPDGKRLIFCSLGNRKPYKATIVTIDPETGEPKGEEPFKPEGVEGPILGATWSQTRPEIFVEEQTDGGFGRALWRVNEDGSGAVKLAEYESIVQFGGCDPTPDGEHVIFFGLGENGHHQLFSVARDGSDRKQLTNVDEELITPQVSPDGTKIAASLYSHSKTVYRKPLPR